MTTPADDGIAGSKQDAQRARDAEAERRVAAQVAKEWSEFLADMVLGAGLDAIKDAQGAHTVTNGAQAPAAAMNRGDMVRLHPPRAWIAPAFVIERIGEHDADVLRGVYFDPDALLAEVTRLAIAESNARLAYGPPWHVSITERDGLPCAIVQHPSNPDRVVIYHAVPE